MIAIAVYLTMNLFHREEEKKDALRRIRERGYMIALTDQNSLNYFIYRGAPMGYQLSLLEDFAKHLGVPFRIIALNDIDKLTYYLHYNAADLIVLNLPVSGEGRKMVHFSDPFGETRLVLVQRHGRDAPWRVPTIAVVDFPADTVHVQKNPFLAGQYEYFRRKTGKRAVILEEIDISQEELIMRVASGKIRYALCQENVTMVLHRYYRDLDISLVAYPLFSCAWGVSHASDSLRDEINSWLREYKASGNLKQTYLEYFGNQRIAGFLKSDYFSVSGDKLSPFDDIIRAQSKSIRWDWRLVASLIYEESNFQAGLVSSRSASGLMQLMPDIAARFGVDSTSSTAQQIAAGVKYLRFIDSQLPDEITDPVERIHFVLASYNVGIGRVMAAREKAEKYGKDKNRWNRHTDYYLLRRSKKDPVAKADSADLYPVDYKTEGFVDDIIARYRHYRNLIR